MKRTYKKKIKKIFVEFLDLTSTPCNVFYKFASEYRRFSKFLTNNGLLKYRIDSKLVCQYLMSRSIKDDIESNFIHLDTLISIRSKLVEILANLGYRNPNPALDPMCDKLIQGYRLKLLEISQVKGHCPPAIPDEVNRAIKIFKQKAVLGQIVGAKLLVILILAKYRGMRGADVIRLKWQQISVGQDTLKVSPIKYKNQRYKARWSFSVEGTKGDDDIIYAINRLRSLTKSKNGNELIFGSWKTTTVSYYFKKFSAEIGSTLTIHKIRVLCALSLTAMNWSDSDIKNYMNWASFESLDTYRQGIHIAALKGQSKLTDFYRDKNLIDKLSTEIRESQRDRVQGT